MVLQSVEVQVYDEYVITGNTGVLKCVIPNYLRELVTVTAWEKDRRIHIYPSSHGGEDLPYFSLEIILTTHCTMPVV